MSRLNELIQELCPDGVEFKKIHDVAEVGTGCCNGNEAEDGGVYPFFVRSQNVKAKNDFQYDEEAIIIPGEGGIGDIFHYVNGKYALHQRVYRIHFIDKTINAKFIYYYMKSNFKSFILKKAVSATVTSIRKPMIEKFEIPIPPLDVQNEIVRILDTFTSHAAELQAELQARKEQYDYYKQFIFKSKISHYKNYLLKNIASFSQGIQVNPSCQYNTMQPGRIRFLRIVDFVSDNEPYRYIERPEDKYIKTEEELIMIRYGASAAGKVFMCHTGAIANNMFKINLNPGILPKYVMYYLSQTSIYTLLNTSGGKSTMPAINFKLVGSINIPIPPLSEQQRIVSILDKFEALVNDLTEGLPAEIAAVQEQYEYYRNKLLTFKDVGTYHGASST